LRLLCLFGASVKPVLSCGMKGVHHVIARLTCSGWDVGVGNGVPRSISVREGASRSDKRIQMSLVTLMGVANPSKWTKPARTMKQRVSAVVRLLGVEGNGACRTIKPGTERPRMPAGNCDTSAGINNRWAWACGESDGPIVAVKRGNSRGAKGP